jgi:hypothetical protein
MTFCDRKTTPLRKSQPRSNLWREKEFRMQLFLGKTKVLWDLMILSWLSAEAGWWPMTEQNDGNVFGKCFLIGT